MADVHLHPSDVGQVGPSGPDLVRANGHTQWIFYLSTPRGNANGPFTFWRYRGPNAGSNVCEYIDDNTWVNTSYQFCAPP